MAMIGYYSYYSKLCYYCIENKQKPISFCRVLSHGFGVITTQMFVSCINKIHFETIFLLVICNRVILYFFYNYYSNEYLISFVVFFFFFRLLNSTNNFHLKRIMTPCIFLIEFTS